MTQKIKTLSIIHLTLCLGTILFYVIISKFSASVFVIPNIDFTALLFAAIPIAAYFLSTYLFRKQLQDINPKSPFEEQLAIYQSASVIRWSVLEGTAFIIGFISKDYMLFGVFIILYLAYLHPTEARIKSDINRVHL